MPTKESEIDPRRAEAAVKIARTQFPDADPADDVSATLDDAWERMQMSILLNKGCPSFLAEHYGGLRWLSMESGDLRKVGTFRSFCALIYRHVVDAPTWTKTELKNGIPKLNAFLDEAKS